MEQSKNLDGTVKKLPTAERVVVAKMAIASQEKRQMEIQSPGATAQAPANNTSRIDEDQKALENERKAAEDAEIERAELERAAADRAATEDGVGGQVDIDA